MENNSYIQREIQEGLFKWLEKKEILAIRGPRQCGKSTLLKRIREEYLKKGLSKENIHYFTFEDEFIKKDFEEGKDEFIKRHTIDPNKDVFLLDEIQYCKNAGKILKLIFDTTKVKIIITGSSTLDMNKLGEFLVGRVLYFELYPLSFSEFLSYRDSQLHNYYLSKRKNLTKLSIQQNETLVSRKELEYYFKEYLLYGGYPQVIKEKDVELKKVLLRNLYTTYLEKDVVALFGLKFKDKMVDLVTYLSNCMGNTIVYDDIMDAINSSYSEVKEMLSILEETFIIQKVKPYHKNKVTELKKNPKYYFLDSGIRNILLNSFDFSQKDWGVLYEQSIFGLLKHIKPKYWRTKNKAEVDFIVEKNYKTLIPIEVKSKSKITRSFRSFLSSYVPNEAIIATFDCEVSKEQIDSTTVYYIPLYLIQYT